VSAKPLIRTHNSYDPVTGSFKVKADAVDTRETLLVMCQRLFVNFPEKAITIEGKKGQYFVHCPRIGFYWSPETNMGMVGELARLHKEFVTVYEENPEP
jgi:hypothetical protein